MSFVNFLEQGPSFGGGVCMRSHYCEVTVDAQRSSYSFRGEIQNKAHNDAAKETTCWVDNAVFIRTVSEKERNEKLQTWDKLKNKTIILSISSFGIFAAGGIYLARQPIPYTTRDSEPKVGAFYGTLVAGMSTAFSVYRLFQARDNYNAWLDDPTSRVQAQRRKINANNQGLDLVFRKKMIGTILTHEEAKHLFFKEMDQFSAQCTQNRSNVAKIRALEDFFVKDILNANRINYLFQIAQSYRIEDPKSKASFSKENIETIINCYKFNKGEYYNFLAQCGDKYAHIENRRRKEIHSNESNRDMALLPFKTIHHYFVEEAKGVLNTTLRGIDKQRKEADDNWAVKKAELQKAIVDNDIVLLRWRVAGFKEELRAHGSKYQEVTNALDHRQAKAQEEYRSSVNKYALMYHVASEPINHYFDGRQQEINHKAERAKARVDAFRESGLLDIYKRISALAGFIKNAKDHDLPPAYFAPVQPSAPMSEPDYDIPLAPPSYHDVMNQQLGGNIDQVAWQHFVSQAYRQPYAA